MILKKSIFLFGIVLMQAFAYTLAIIRRNCNKCSINYSLELNIFSLTKKRNNDANCSAHLLKHPIKKSKNS